MAKKESPEKNGLKSKAGQTPSFFKNALSYSGLNILAQFVTLVRGFIVRRILPPEIMGVWNFVFVVQSFFATFELGAVAGATRELPILQGQARAEEVEKVQSTTLTFYICQNLLLTLAALVYVHHNRAAYEGPHYLALITGVIMLNLQGIVTVFVTFFAGASAFVPLSVLLLISALIEGAAFPLAALIGGLKGILAAGVIVGAVKVYLFYRAGKPLGFGTRFRMSWEVLKRLLSFGFFLRFVDYPASIMNLASVLWVTRLMGAESLALFTLGRSFFLQVVDVSTRVGTVFNMKYLEESGRGASREERAAGLKRFLYGQLLVVTPLMSWAAAVAAPFTVRHFIPKYEDANPLIVILLLCGFFYVINSGLTNPWVLEKKLVQRGAANVVGLAAMGLCLAVPWYVFGRQDLITVAWATAAGYFLYFVYMTYAVGRGLWSRRDSTVIVVSVTLAAAVTFCVCYRGLIWPVPPSGFWADAVFTFKNGAWSLLLISPLPLAGLWPSGLHRRIFRRAKA